MCAISQSQKAAIGGSPSTMLGSSSLVSATGGPMFRTLIASSSPSTTSKTGTTAGPGSTTGGGGGSGGGGSGGRNTMAY